MANNILITPGSASITFSGSAANTIRLQVEPSGSVAFYGASGSLFGITDQLSGSLMSVNDISGLPILEVFSDDRVVMGTYNTNALVVTGSKIGINKSVPTATVDITGSTTITGSLNVLGTISGSISASYATTASAATSITFIPATASYALNTSTVGFNVDNHAFVGNGATVNYTLSSSYALISLNVSVDGLTYTPTTDYSVAGTTLTFVNAPPSESNIFVKAWVNAATGATGSFNGTFSGSFFGVILSSSYAATASYVTLPAGTVSSSAQYPGWVTASSQIDYNSIQNKLSGVVSSSTQVQPLLPGGTVSSSAQYPGWVTASSQIDYNSIQNKLSGVVSSSTQVASLLPNGTVSSSAQYPGWVTASSQIVWSSVNYSSGIVSSSAQFNALTGTSASFATTANNINGGSTNYIPLWSSATALSSSNLYQSAGNVGIGTTSPNSKLDVNGTTIVSGAFTTTGNGRFWHSNTSTYTQFDNTNELNTYTSAGGATTLYINYSSNSTTNIGKNAVTVIGNNGNVGIGITSPSQKLHVSGSSRFSLPDGGYPIGIQGTTKGIRFLTDANQSVIQGVDTTLVGSYQPLMIGGSMVLVQVNGVTEVMRIDTSGNVGIGTTSPSTILHVNGASTGKTISDYNFLLTDTTTYDTGVGGGIGFEGKYSSGGSIATWASIKSYKENATDGNYSAALAFGTRANGGSLTERMRIDSSGKVGIGTPSPNNLLHLYTTGNNPEIIVEKSSTYAARFGVNSGNIGYVGSINATPFQIQTNGIVRVYMETDGKVGIGTTAPSASLHVSGTMMVQQIIEKVNVTASAPPATFNIDLTSGSLFFRSASTAANWTLNFRGDVGTTLNSMMYNGQSITATVLVFNGATPYSASAYQIDGATVTPRWQGGTSGSANANSLDAHQFTIIKIASASYHVLGSITKYT